MTTEENVNMGITRYFHDGIPVCATSFTDGDVCPFLRVSNFGSEVVCCIDNDVYIQQSINGEPLNYLTPNIKCKIHNL